MKTPKPKRLTKEEKEVARQISQRTERDRLHRRYFQFGIKPQPAPAKLPSAEKLATLAATLANRLPGETPEKLCGLAISFWTAATEAIQLQTQCNADYEKGRAELPTPEAYPSTAEFPIGAMQSLRYAFPNSTDEQRASLHHEFMKWIIPRENGSVLGPAPSDEEVAARIQSEKPFTAQEFQHFRDEIRRWHKTVKIRSVRRKSGKAGGVESGKTRKPANSASPKPKPLSVSRK